MGMSYVSLTEASEVRICCDKMGKQEWSGRIYTRLQREPLTFCAAEEILYQLEKFYDWLDYPQASVVSRTFWGTGKIPAKEKTEKADRKGARIAVLTGDDMGKKYGERATFLVKIQCRQNATWQGQVTWAEKNQTVNFRSALELLKLMDSTMEINELEKGESA